MFWHNLAQFLAGKLVGAPLSAVVVTATLMYQIYQGDRTYPSRVHLVRGLGGPAGNLLLGIAALAANAVVGDNGFLRFVTVLNLLFAVASLAPIPTMDGGALLHELQHWRSD